MKKAPAENDRRHCSAAQENPNRENLKNGTSDKIGKFISGEKIITGTRIFRLHCIKYGNIFAGET
ncbi:MAG: hypothetical protein IKO93_02785 [Lentisphaeria bacterium]|nr:hypothetical protein [Lentisphaeria bacterium]